jgi:hypothetical protein
VPYGKVNAMVINTSYFAVIKHKVCDLLGSQNLDQERVRFGSEQNLKNIDIYSNGSVIPELYDLLLIRA